MVNLSIIKKKIEEFLAPKEKVSVGMVMAEIPNSVKTVVKSIGNYFLDTYAPAVLETKKKMEEGKSLLQSYKEAWKEADERTKQEAIIAAEKYNKAEKAGASIWELSKIATESPKMQQLAQMTIGFMGGMKTVSTEEAKALITAATKLTRADLQAITAGKITSGPKYTAYQTMAANPILRPKITEIAMNKKIPLTDKVVNHVKDFISSITEKVVPKEVKLLPEKITPGVKPLAEQAKLVKEAKKYESAEEFVRKSPTLNMMADFDRRTIIENFGSYTGFWYSITGKIPKIDLNFVEKFRRENFGFNKAGDRIIPITKLGEQYAQRYGMNVNEKFLTDFYNQAVKGISPKGEKVGLTPKVSEKLPPEQQKITNGELGIIKPQEQKGQGISYTSKIAQGAEKVKKPLSLGKLRLKEKPKLITRPEDVLLRERIRAEARGAKQGIQGYKQQEAFLKSLQNEITRELGKPKGLQRSKIAFIKKLGEFNQTAMNEIKTELGIEKPISQMNLTELRDFIGKLKERLRFKFEKGYEPSAETKETLKLKDEPSPQLTDKDYQQNRIQTQKKVGILRRIIKQKEKITETGEKILTPISTRLENIDPSLKFALRKFEYNVGNITQKDKITAQAFLKKIKKLNKDDWADFDLASKNGDISKINKLAKKYNFTSELEQVRKMLDDIYKRANDVGFDIGYQKNYFPRIIKDVEGFLEYFGKQDYWSILEEAIKRKEMELGRFLKQEERAYLVNTMIRGYQGGQITLSGTGAMKSRVIDMVTPEINQFYHNTKSALLRYIQEVNEKIEARKFFGKSNKTDQFNNIEDSIGNYTAKLLSEGKITPNQEFELRSILTARFNPKGTHGIIGLYKNLAYIDVMGSFLNAVTQLGDQVWALYRAGLWKTIKADIKSIFGKAELTKEDLGIEAEKVAEEFMNGSRLAKVVDKVFALTGLTKIDRLGKQALVNATLEKYQNIAEKPSVDFLKKLDEIFGKESDQVLMDLKSRKITENIKLLMFNELLDFHPVALSEMPEEYLKGGNGRIFYILKSYILKQLDIFRREAFREMARGNWLKGFRNLLYLTFLIMLVNGTADEIKDLLTHRKTSLKDRTIDQLAILIGFSRYNFNKISEVGVGSALLEVITPPINFIDNISKDLLALYKDFDESANINKLRSIQDIPLIGKFYYWWFGKGAENTKKYAPKESSILIPDIKIPSIKIPSIELPNIEL